MSVGKIAEHRTERQDAPRGPQQRALDQVPSELIAIEAYHKWEGRCRMLGRIDHGRDRVDWLEAEAKLGDKWQELTPEDVAAFQQRIALDGLVPSPQRVAVRAYYKSIASADRSPEQAQRNWMAAESEERTILFAEAFYRFFAQLHPSPHRAGQLVSTN